jgi:hypothetical protein
VILSVDAELRAELGRLEIPCALQRRQFGNVSSVLGKMRIGDGGGR